jgi:hypothetical protein
VFGTGLANCRVFLAGRSTQVEVPCSGIATANQISFSGCTLSGIQAGTYDIVVEKPSGDTALAPSAVRIE